MATPDRTLLTEASVTAPGPLRTALDEVAPHGSTHGNTGSDPVNIHSSQISNASNQGRYLLTASTPKDVRTVLDVTPGNGMGVYPADTNADTMTETGDWWSSGAFTPANGFPWVPHAFGIFSVRRSNGSPYTRQTIQTSNDNPVIWTRTSRGGTWSAWEVVGQILHTDSPRGVISAPGGTVVVDVNGTRGARQWLKLSDAGTNDWVVTHGDTGWVNTTAFLQAGFTTTVSRVRRIGERVIVNLQGDVTAGTNSYVASGMPFGWRPSSQGVNFPIFAYEPAGDTLALGHLGLNASGTTFVRIAASGSMYFECSWITDNTWPTTLSI